MLRDLPLLGIVTLSYVIARNPRVDIGFPVEVRLRLLAAEQGQARLRP